MRSTSAVYWGARTRRSRLVIYDATKHQASIHGVNIIYYECKEEGCEYKAKEAGHLKSHLAHIHDIGVVWHKCDHKGCSFKAKAAGTLRRHQAGIHVVDVTYVV